MYFSGNENIWYVRSVYNETTMTIIKELGVTDSIQVHHKSSNEQGFLTLRECHGWHMRGLNGFDPDTYVDGLECALTNPLTERSLFIWTNIAVPYSMCIRGVVESSTRQTYENSTKEDRVSEKFGRFLIDTAWLPDTKGQFHIPSELSIDDLPDSFIRDEKLADQLGMKKDVVSKLAEAVGIKAEDINFIMQRLEEFQQWKEEIEANKESAFPTKTSSDQARRKTKIIEKFKNAPKKKYEKETKSTKTTENTIDAKTFLNETYKNEAEELICQICQKRMPFKKKDGNYYFEAVEIIVDFDREMEELHIALCPVCAARYNEFVKRGEGTMERLKSDLINSDNPNVPLVLGELKTSVRFVESHWLDIRTILQEIS